MKLRSISITLLLLASLMALPLTVLAQQNTSVPEEVEEQQTKLLQRTDQLEARLQQAEERLSQLQARRCEFVKARLEFHRDRATAIREHRKTRYQHIIDRLNALADRLDVSGLDSTALRAAIASLSDLVETYADTYTDYEAALQDALNVVCDNTQVSKPAVSDARELLVKLHSNAESIHTFFQDELKPLLADIKELIQAARQAQTDRTNESEE